MTRERTPQLVAMMVEMIYPQVMVHLGKIKNPMTDKIERHLDAARMLIDILGELEEKTEGRLTDPEKKMLQKALTELRLNYLDELNRPAPAGEAAADEAAPPAGGSAATAGDESASASAGDPASAGTSSPGADGPAGG